MLCSSCGAQNDDSALFCAKCGNQLVNKASGSTGSASTHASVVSPPSVVLYAGFWKRLAAMLIDWLILAIGGFLIGIVIGLVFMRTSRGVGTELEALSDIAGFFLSWLYFTLMESSSSQGTFGKMALGIKVVDLNGDRISFGRATGRFFSKIISGLILCIGYLMAAFTARKQALHDMMASCLVVNKEVTASDLQQGGAAKPMSTGAIVALALGAGILPIVGMGILAAIALPAYQDNVMRARMTQVVLTGDQATKAIEAFMVQNNSLPATIEQTQFSVPPNNIKQVTIDSQNGVVLLTMNFDPVMDKHLAFVPVMDGGQIVGWKCTSNEIPPKYLPERCRNS